MTEPTNDWVVVGAGPAGLSAAAALRERGLEPLVLEQGTGVGTAWRTARYDRLHLHTVRSLSGLPGLAIPKGYGRWVARDDFVDYLDAYARRFAIEPGSAFASSGSTLPAPGGDWRRPTAASVHGALPWRRASATSRAVPSGLASRRFGASSCTRWSTGTPSAAAGATSSSWARGTRAPRSRSTWSRGGASRVMLAVRTPPNIVRRDRFGIPAQVLGIALGKLPRRALDPIGRSLRRLTIPDLSAYGLPAPVSEADETLLPARTAESRNPLPARP